MIASVWCFVTIVAFANGFLFNEIPVCKTYCHSPIARVAFNNQRKFALAMDTTMATPVITGNSESYKFGANVGRVMDIIINSLYSNKDVFLRELISNAADACDKKRFLCLEREDKGPPLSIRISTDRDAGTLTIEDTGIGMNKEDLIANLGRIAESGTKKFTANMSAKEKEMTSLIGQFGVGFYSGFLVANKIEVISKGNKSEQLRWEAKIESLDQYSITPDESTPIEQTGTRIILHIKDECEQYLDDVHLKSLIEKYSEFVSVPIELQKNVTKPETVPDPDAPVGEDGVVPTKTVMRKYTEWTVVNNKKPLWLRPKKEVTPEEYTEFYQQTFKAFDTPTAHAHFAIEGGVDFKALLYLPSEIPYELTRDMFANAARSMRLYVKRVFINDKFEDLIPRWLLFLRGVVDSDDLPLNVGREILQQSKSLRIIKQRLVKKSVDMMAELALRNETEYMTFYRNFGKYLKVGVIEDEKARVDLIPLIRFFSSHSAANDSSTMTSLPEYVRRMSADQKNIYYVVGESRAQAAESPALERLKQKGHEVIYLCEPLDEMVLQNIEQFDGKMLCDVGKELNEELSEEEKKKKQETNQEIEPLREWVKGILGDRITRVEASTRLVDSPATLVQSEYGVSPSMQKFLKAQAVANDDNGKFTNIFNQAVLEINPTHPIIMKLDQIRKEDKDSPQGKDTVELLFNTAALAAGYVLENSADYSKLVTRMMSRLSSV